MATACMDNIEQDEVLRIVALELMYNNPQKWLSPDGPTALEIARRQNIKVEIVKKKLNILNQEGLVRSVGISPKRWQFDEYQFGRMDAEHPMLRLITRYDDYDYEKYYF